MVGGRHGEIAFPKTRPIAEIVLDAARVPASFFRIDEVEAVLLTLIETDIVEDKELGFRPEIGRVGHPGGCQIKLSLTRNVTRIAVVALLGDRIDHIRHHHQRRHLRERVQEVGAGIGNQQHVALVDRSPTPDGGPIHSEAFFKPSLGQLLNRVGDVMP